MNAYKTIHTKGHPKTLRTLNRIMRTAHVEDNQAIIINEPKPMSSAEISKLRDSGFTGTIKLGFVVNERGQ